MSRQVLRCLWLGPLRKIRGRADDRHAHVRPDAHGDHALRDLLAPPYAGVKSLRDDVCEAVVDRHFDMDVRILGQQLAESG